MRKFLKDKEIDQKRRRRVIIRFIIIIILLFIMSIICLFVYMKRNDRVFVRYNESSNIDYKVFLKENNFFDNDYLESNKQYIASLLDYIVADFNYKLSFENEAIEYKYLYRIESSVDVIDDDTDNFLYTNNEVILDEKEFITTEKEIIIKENINIDYNYYNNLISRFVSVYDLEDAISTLNINMYVKIIGSFDDNDGGNEKESVISLSIPLTTKTVAIDLSNNLVNSENNVLRYKSSDDKYFKILIVGILFLFVDLVLGLIMMLYIIRTRSAKNIYEVEVRKILNNYGSYIQPLDNDLSFEGYQLLEINSFNDMLEIRDTIRQPILMRENKDKTGVLFMIPNNTKILYVYRLRIVDIEKRK